MRHHTNKKRANGVLRNAEDKIWVLGGWQRRKRDGMFKFNTTTVRSGEGDTLEKAWLIHRALRMFPPPRPGWLWTICTRDDFKRLYVLIPLYDNQTST